MVCLEKDDWVGVLLNNKIDRRWYLRSASDQGPTNEPFSADRDTYGGEGLLDPSHGRIGPVTI